jgi:ubiquinone biosynthesis protein UbiJ
VSSDDPAIALINGDLTIGGDSRLLQQLQRLLGELDIDWEAPIAAVTGDVVGHQIGRSLRGILAWGKTSRASIERQLKEFIIEEARLSPSEAELCDFYDDIRRLQQTIDRVDAKIKRLSRRRNPA